MSELIDREAAHKKYPDALIDPATIDEIMLMHIRGEKSDRVKVMQLWKL